MVEATITAAAQSELSALFALPNADQTLSDGNAWLHADYSNLAAGTSKDAAGLAAAAALAAQEVNNKSADCQPHLLLVPSADAATARKLVADASLPGTPWMDLRATSDLSSDRWYLLADPAVWPALVRATLPGSESRSVVWDSSMPNAWEGFGAVIVGNLTFDYGVVSRVGIVNMTFA
jgi:hypothetical protein